MGVPLRLPPYFTSRHTMSADAANNNNVGTRMIHEDELTRVWEMRLKPGESAPPHTHRLSYTFYIMEGSTIAVTDPNIDEIIFDFKANAGDVMSFKAEGDKLIPLSANMAPIPATHGAKNIGTTYFVEILVERK